LRSVIGFFEQDGATIRIDLKKIPALWLQSTWFENLCHCSQGQRINWNQFQESD
jgi:hypothetical protein